MNRPNFISPISEKNDFCEVSSETPISDFVPNQAITIAELVQRFERGQRLNVHANFAPGSNFQNIDDETALQQIRTENIDTDDFPPTDVHDIADVEAHYRLHEEHKADFKKRQAEKAAQRKAKEAQPPTPPAPPEPQNE